MAIYFKNGFYHDHAPDGAVEIDEQTYLALLDGQAQGKEIAADDAGYPVLGCVFGGFCNSIASRVTNFEVIYLATVGEFSCVESAAYQLFDNDKKLV